MKKILETTTQVIGSEEVPYFGDWSKVYQRSEDQNPPTVLSQRQDRYFIEGMGARRSLPPIFAEESISSAFIISLLNNMNNVSTLSSSIMN